jgi:Cu+-exporting ATPase
MKAALALATAATLASIPALVLADPTSTSCPLTQATAACCASTSTACCAEADPALTQVDFDVEGIDCAGCEASLTKALTSIEGVGKASASSSSKQVSVSFDGTKVKEKNLLAAIKKAGFKVQAETVQLKIDGMSGEACSGKLSDAVAKVKGVKEQTVCHVSNQAVVKFDPSRLTREQLIAAIDKTGFKVLP